MKLALSDFKNVRFSKDLVALFLNRILIRTAFGVVGIFLTIFFYEIFDRSIHATILVFIGVYWGTMFLTPVSAQFINRLGIKPMMVFSVPFALLSLLVLFFWEYNPVLVSILHVCFIVLYKTLYWVPYHIDFAKFTDKRTRGRQMSVLVGFSEMVFSVTPLVGGFVIAFFGYNHLFLISAVLFMVALLPTFFIGKTKEVFSYGYMETFSELFKKKNRSILIPYMGDGAQSAIKAVIWPIFIFILLDGKYLTIGIVSTLVIITLIILRLIVGDIIDQWSRTKMLTISSVVYTTGWIIKIFVETAFQIFLVDTYHNMGRVVNRLSFDAVTYDQAADNGHYIDEFTVLKETALNLGRGGILVAVAGLVFFVDIKIIFVFAAIGTLLMTLLNHRTILQEKVAS